MLLLRIAGWLLFTCMCLYCLFWARLVVGVGFVSHRFTLLFGFD